MLKKYGLKCHDFSFVERINNVKAVDMTVLRRRLMALEDICSERYFKQIFGLLPEPLRRERRKTFKAYDGVNNVFNLAYEVLSRNVQHTLIKAKLEHHLGFLHSTAMGKPSLICDFQELHRYLVDDFVIQFWRSLGKEDFILKSEDLSTNRKGKRERFRFRRNAPELSIFGSQHTHAWI